MGVVRKLLLGTFISCLWVATPQIAEARSAVEKARAAYRQGRHLLDKGRHLEAEQRFRKASSLLPRGRRASRTQLSLRYFISICRYRDGDLEAAIPGLQAYISNGAREGWKRNARRLLTRARSRLAKKRAAARHGSRRGARTKGRPPARSRTAPRSSKTVAVRTATAPTGPKPGKTTPGSPGPGPKGGRVAAVAGRPPSPAAGRSGPARRRATAPAAALGRPAPPPRRSFLARNAPLTLMAAGAAAVIAGGVLLGVGSSAQGERDQMVQDARARGPSIQDTERILDLDSQQRTQLTAGWVVGGVGLGTAAAGLSWWLLRRKGWTGGLAARSTPEGMRLRLRPSPTAARNALGFSLMGSFK